MKSRSSEGENANENNNTSNILLKLRSLINTDDDNPNSFSNNHLKLQEREKLIDELKKLVDSSSRPNRRVVQKKKKKKRIKRQDLLKEILEDTSSGIVISKNKGTTGANYIENIAKNNEIHSHNLNLTEENFKFDFDSHRFGVNLYNDDLFQDFGLTDKHFEPSDSNYPLFQYDRNKNQNAINHAQDVKGIIDSPQLHAKDIYRSSSQDLKKYLKSYGLLDKNSSDSFTEFTNRKVDILGFARQHFLLEDDIPKPDPELLRILGLPMEYNPYLIEGRPSNIVLVYSRPLEQFRIKHDLLSDIQKKELKKYRNRIASRKFRRTHSKSSKNHINPEASKSLYETIIFNLMPEIEQLEENLKKLISENENLNEQLKLKYKQKLTI